MWRQTLPGLMHRARRKLWERPGIALRALVAISGCGFGVRQAGPCPHSWDTALSSRVMLQPTAELPRRPRAVVTWGRGEELQVCGSGRILNKLLKNLS